MRLYVTIVCFVLFFSGVSGQNGSFNFAKVGEAYSKFTSMSFQIEVYGYEGLYDQKPDLLGKGKSESTKDYKYSIFSENQFLQNSDFTLMVDKGSKMISLYESSKAKSSKLKDVSLGLDSLLKIYDSLIVDKGVENNQRKFVMTAQKSEIIETHIFVNVITNLIEKVVYYYNKDADLEYIPEFNSVVIYYKNYVTNKQVFKKHEISEFVTKTPKGYVPTLSLKGYRIEFINHNRKTS